MARDIPSFQGQILRGSTVVSSGNFLHGGCLELVSFNQSCSYMYMKDQKLQASSEWGNLDCQINLRNNYFLIIYLYIKRERERDEQILTVVGTCLRQLNNQCGNRDSIVIPYIHLPSSQKQQTSLSWNGCVKEAIKIWERNREKEKGRENGTLKERILSELFVQETVK